jgi:hypothetical protein
MSLLTATQGTPARVYGLVRLLHEAAEALPTDTIAGWLVPRNIIGRDEVVRPKEALEQTISAARSLRLISENSPVSPTVPVPDAIEGFADVAHRQLCALPNDDANIVVLKVYAWFVIRADQDPGSLYRPGREALAAEIDGAFPRSEGEAARTFNSTKFAPWARWVSFLGLGSELPNAPFFPYPAERVLRELRAIAAVDGFDTDLDFRDVRNQLSRRMSYLDGGEIFGEMSQRLGLRTRTLSRVLSSVLRDLHQEGQIQLTALGDSAERVPFAPDPMDQTGLPGANRIRIVGEVQHAL